MAQVIGGNQVKLDNGQTVTAQTGGWYDGQQFWNGNLSEPGQINPQSDQQGAGQLVSNEVIAQTKPENVPYIAKRREEMNLAPTQPGPSTPAPAQIPAQTGQTPSTGEGITGLPGMGEQPAINLPELYKTLTATSGISELEKELSDKEKLFIEATGEINDNPFLSEATRVGRVAKLDELYQKRTANLRGDIVTKKADIEMQLNLRMKQFDINSQMARDGLSYANTLLEMGALDSASGDLIAQMTRMTGIPSEAWRSAIESRKKKDVETHLIQSESDSGEVTVSVVNSKTGDIINQTSLGNIGNAEGGSGGGVSTSEQKAIDEGVNQQSLVNDAKAGYSLRQLIDHYGVPGGLSIEQIYRIYNSNSTWGQAKESLKEVKEGIYQDN